MQYLEDGTTLWVMSGSGAEKTWWRNVAGGGRVEVLLRGRVRQAHADAFTPEADPDVVAAGLQRYLERFPGMAKRLGVPPGDGAALQRAVAATVMVRIDLA